MFLNASFYYFKPNKFTFIGEYWILFHFNLECKEVFISFGQNLEISDTVLSSHYYNLGFLLLLGSMFQNPGKLLIIKHAILDGGFAVHFINFFFGESRKTRLIINPRLRANFQNCFKSCSRTCFFQELLNSWRTFKGALKKFIECF